jgi:hypothetical protein
MALRFGSLSVKYTWLVEALQNLKITSIKDLVSYDFDKWYSLVKQTGAPSWVAGDDADAQAKTYAKLLTVAMERTYPSATVVYKLRNATTTDPNLIKFFDNRLISTSGQIWNNISAIRRTLPSMEFSSETEPASKPNSSSLSAYTRSGLMTIALRP